MAERSLANKERLAFESFLRKILALTMGAMKDCFPKVKIALLTSTPTMVLAQRRL